MLRRSFHVSECTPKCKIRNDSPCLYAYYLPHKVWNYSEFCSHFRWEITKFAPPYWQRIVTRECRNGRKCRPYPIPWQTIPPAFPSVKAVGLGQEYGFVTLVPLANSRLVPESSVWSTDIRASIFRMIIFYLFGFYLRFVGLLNLNREGCHISSDLGF